MIAILTAILFPTLRGATTAAKRAKTRVQFSQWSSALEGFRQEYGYYPNFGNPAFPGDQVINTAVDTTLFVQTLTGRRLDGSALVAGTTPDPGLSAGNLKRIVFSSFGTDDINAAGILQDAFKLTTPRTAILLDRTGDGLIRIAATDGDYTAAQVPIVFGTTAPTGLGDNTTIRAPILFYSPGVGETADDIVKSWD